MFLRLVRTVLVWMLLLGGDLLAEDWHQWRGVDRLGVWHETGIVDHFPEGGLKTTWSQ